MDLCSPLSYNCATCFSLYVDMRVLSQHQQDVSFAFPMWWAIPTFTHFPCKNRTSPWLVRIRDVAVLTQWQSWGATSGLTITQPGTLSRRQTGSSRTPRALSLELVWIPGLQTVGHSSVCTWSFPTSDKPGGSSFLIQQGEVSREKGHWSQGRVKHSKLGHETTGLLSLLSFGSH